jgi:hypothetical protein
MRATSLDHLLPERSPGAFISLASRWESSDPFRRRLVPLRFDRCEGMGAVQGSGMAPVYSASALGRPLPKNATGPQFESRRRDSKLATLIMYARLAGQIWGRCGRHDGGREANPWLDGAGKTLQHRAPAPIARLTYSGTIAATAACSSKGLNVSPICWTSRG